MGPKGSEQGQKQDEEPEPGRKQGPRSEQQAWAAETEYRWRLVNLRRDMGWVGLHCFETGGAKGELEDRLYHWMDG